MKPTYWDWLAYSRHVNQRKPSTDTRKTPYALTAKARATTELRAQK